MFWRYPIFKIKNNSMRRKSGWSDLHEQFQSNCFLIEWLSTKFHWVAIKKVSVIAILNFLYRQLFVWLGWFAKKWLDRYKTVQLHTGASKGPAYQISAWSAKNCRSYLIFRCASHLYKRVCPSVGPLVRWSIGPLVRFRKKVEIGQNRLKWENKKYMER